MKRDLTSGLVAAGFAVFVYAEAGRFAESGASLADNPALYPRILAVIVFAMGVVLIVRAMVTFLKVRKERPPEEKTEKSAGMRYVALTVALLTVYVGMIHLLGFIVPTIAFTVVTQVSLGTKLKTAVFVGIPLTTALYLLFFIFFKVPIPSGILFE